MKEIWALAVFGVSPKGLDRRPWGFAVRALSDQRPLLIFEATDFQNGDQNG
jgi:hypothetical protein